MPQPDRHPSCDLLTGQTWLPPHARETPFVPSTLPWSSEAGRLLVPYLLQLGFTRQAGFRIGISLYFPTSRHKTTAVSRVPPVRLCAFKSASKGGNSALLP